MSEQEIAIAAGYAQTVLALVPKTPNYTGIAAADRFFVGYLGEFATRNWLASIDASYEYRVVLSGKTERSEFTVRCGDSLLELEVKTAGKANHDHYMQPAAQKIDASIFLGARRVDDGVVQIMGWLNADEIRALPIQDFGYGPTRAVSFGGMRDLAALEGALHAARFRERG